jgi:hypothetical protein
MVLLLILNVIIVTAVTSFVLMWYLERRDNRKLTVELNLRRESDQHDPKTPLTETPATMDHREEFLKQPLWLPGDARLVPPAFDQDIRQYVAHRARSWAALSVVGTVPPGN